jgi:formylglycine-generating enzyme required for sulfatase activity
MIAGTFRLGFVMAGLLVASCSEPAGTNAPSTTFKDCAECPEMVRIPAGEFTMGSPPSEMYRGAEAQHSVNIPAFALGKHEVTFDQWDACVADGGCNGYKPEDQGWGRGNRPVINVSWADAKAYAEWLSRKTGKAYRLPSEAEWEYAGRAGTTTAFSFGDSLTTQQANFDGSPNGENRQQTMPVGSFPPNAFGLHDMHGNVFEWIEDCWSDEYTSATPANGAPFTRENCQGHVMRGGSWEDYAGEARAAARVGAFTDDAFPSDGFRVALSLE